MKWREADKKAIGETLESLVSAVAAAKVSFSKLGSAADSGEEYRLLQHLEIARDAASAAVVDLDIAITEHEKGAPS